MEREYYGYSPSPRDPSRYGTATPSPRPWYGADAAVYGAATARPHTRAHVRAPSTGEFYGSPRGIMSPRYTSSGQYATDTSKVSHLRTRKQSFSGTSGARSGRGERRHSQSYGYGDFDSPGESDEDEYIEINGVTYIVPAESKMRRRHAREHVQHIYVNAGGYGTNYHNRRQEGYEPRHDPYVDTRFQTPAPTKTRRMSNPATHMPPRSQTTRPGSSRKGPATPLPTRKVATDADAKKYRIPAGYSLKNWDPTEEPIMLLGSVFDANSLGKWVYDWTVYHHGPATPISDMAGELWLLLINLAGKIKKSEEAMPRIRLADNKELVEDFIESGDRLTDKLRKLLKTCEAPMLKAAQKNNQQLGKDAGVEFVRTLFGRDRELEKTERFMHSVRLWNLRFDANCTDVIENPTI
jgi:hypothetical protein